MIFAHIAKGVYRDPHLTCVGSRWTKPKYGAQLIVDALSKIYWGNALLCVRG